MQQLRALAKSTNKMLVLTIHQPSKRIYNMFDSLLLMAKGSVDYFGEAHEAPLEFFKSHGFDCEQTYNPVDFYLETWRDNTTELNKVVSLDSNTLVRKHPEESASQIQTIAETVTESPSSGLELSKLDDFPLGDSVKSNIAI